MTDTLDKARDDFAGAFLEWVENPNAWYLLNMWAASGDYQRERDAP